MVSCTCAILNVSSVVPVTLKLAIKVLYFFLAAIFQFAFQFFLTCTLAFVVKPYYM